MISKRIAVCEDEEVYSSKLAELVSGYFADKVFTPDIITYTDGMPLIKAMSEGTCFDIIFCDIMLESSDGMNVAAAIRLIDDSVPIIFVTSLEDRAVEGYSVKAFDYIIKSSLDERLSAVLDRLNDTQKSETLSVTTDGGDTEVIPLREILFIESDGRGTRIAADRGDICSPMPVGKVSEMLPNSRFIEVHKSVYVQISRIKRIGADVVEIENGEKLPISRRKRKDVLSAVMNGIKGGLV